MVCGVEPRSWLLLNVPLSTVLPRLRNVHLGRFLLLLIKGLHSELLNKKYTLLLTFHLGVHIHSMNVSVTCLQVTPKSLWPCPLTQLLNYITNGLLGIFTGMSYLKLPMSSASGIGRHSWENPVIFDIVSSSVFFSSVCRFLSVFSTIIELFTFSPLS